MSLIPWAGGKAVIWDFTCADTYAASYLNDTSRCAGAAAKSAESKKISKYYLLQQQFIFMPVCIETSGVWGQNAISFIKNIGHKISIITGEPKSTFYLIQRISLAVQRGNVASVMGSIPSSKRLEEIFYL